MDQSLVTDPAVLLLDEPLSALDHATQSRIIADLRAWNAARRIPILYVTHSLREVFALGERVLVLEKGRVTADGTPQDVMHAPPHESIAQLAGFENILNGTVTALRPDLGTMECALAGTNAEVEVPLGALPVGSKVRLAVRAGDILLATAPPQGLSARNILPGTIRVPSSASFTSASTASASPPIQPLLAGSMRGKRPAETTSPATSTLALRKNT